MVGIVKEYEREGLRGLIIHSHTIIWAEIFFPFSLAKWQRFCLLESTIPGKGFAALTTRIE
jgi:hypothetical protein